MKRASRIIVTTLALNASICTAAAFATNPDNVDFSVTVNPSLTLSVSSNNVNLNILPSSTGTFGKTNFTVTSSTNNIAGYTLTMANGTTYLESSTLDPNTGTKPHIETLANGNITESTFTNATTAADGLNKWGIAINTGNYNPASTTASTIKETDTYNQVADTTTINIASKLDLNIPAGTYADTFNFQLVANTAPVTLEMAYRNAQKSKITVNNNEYYTMQDMNSDICLNTNVIPSELQVADTRDNNIYWIAKLADGKCWMTQNLDLDLSDQTALVHATSDIGWGSDTATMSWMPERSTIVVNSTTTNAWVDDVYNPYSADVGVRYYTDTWFNDACNSREGCNYLGNTANGKFSNSPYSGNGEHGRIGNYYNWTAAIASNDSSDMIQHEAVAQNSICPAGWRLPTAYTVGSEKTNEFKNLLEAYDPDHTSDEIILGAPIYYTRAGNFYEKILSWAGNSGSYWSSVADNDQEDKYAQYMYFRNDSVAPTYAHKRIVGWNVRCIAR